LWSDEIFSFVGIKEGVEASDALVIRLTPVDDAAFRSWYTCVLETACDFTHSHRVLLGSHGIVPKHAEGFRSIRNIAERFRTVRHISESFRRVRRVTEAFRTVRHICMLFSRLIHDSKVINCEMLRLS